MDNINYLIKSSDRNSGNSADFKIASTELLQGTYLVKHVMIPNTVNNVNAANNYFTLTDNGTTKDVYVPVGNYTVNTLLPAIQTAMNTASGGYNTYTLTIGSTNSLLSCSATNPFTVTPITAQRMLGITGATPLASTFTSTYIVQVAYPNSLGIVIEGSSTDNVQNIKTGATCTIYVPMNRTYGYYKTLDTEELEQRIYFNHATRMLRIRIVDTTTNGSVSLNGGDFEMILTKECKKQR